MIVHCVPQHSPVRLALNVLSGLREKIAIRVLLGLLELVVLDVHWVTLDIPIVLSNVRCHQHVEITHGA